MYVETMNTGSFSSGTRLCGSYTVEYTLRAELIYSLHLHIFSWPFWVWNGYIFIYTLAFQITTPQQSSI